MQIESASHNLFVKKDRQAHLEQFAQWLWLCMILLQEQGLNPILQIKKV